MFTGLIEGCGTIASVEQHGTGLRIDIEHALTGPVSALAVGDSVAVDGVCLTAVAATAGKFTVELSAETLAHTTFCDAASDRTVHLEAALRAGDSLGGHFVSGHVDGTGEITAIAEDGPCRELTIKMPAALARFIADRGSICVDGISLTVTGVTDTTFSVMIIPHTQSVTRAETYRQGIAVNLEVDLLARYLARLAEAQDTA